MLEPHTARIALRATPEQVENLRALAVHYTPGDRDRYEAYLRANSIFHRTLVRCCGNTLLEGMVTSALDRHQRPLYLGLDVGIAADAAAAEHVGLVDAIESKDADSAAPLMAEHVSHAEERIVPALRAAGYR